MCFSPAKENLIPQKHQLQLSVKIYHLYAPVHIEIVPFRLYTGKKNNPFVKMKSVYIVYIYIKYLEWL